MSKWEKQKGESENEHFIRVSRMLEMADVMRRDRIKPEDSDFAEKVGKYMAGEIDPSVARHHELPISDNIALSLKGVNSRKGNPEKEKMGSAEGKNFSVVIRPNTVNAIHNANTPQVYGHEYRHRNYPNLSEREVREVDLVAAQTPHDVDQAVRMYADALKARVPSDALGDIGSKLGFHGNFGTAVNKAVKAETGQSFGDAVDSSEIQKLLDDSRELDKYNRGLEYRNKKRRAGEPETIAGHIRELIEEYN